MRQRERDKSIREREGERCNTSNEGRVLRERGEQRGRGNERETMRDNARLTTREKEMQHE